MQVHRHVPSLNISCVAGCLTGRCFRAIGKIGKPIWLVSLLLWMRAAGLKFLTSRSLGVGVTGWFGDVSRA
jgi:hypothetical protein